jgi:CheY-like chemotaxis protein
VIVSAAQLPDMTALDIPGILQADPKTAKVPVVLLGDGGEQALMGAFRAGCEQYVDSRLGPEHVAVQVRIFLEGRKPDDSNMPEIGPETTLSGTLSHLDVAGIVQMLGQLRQSGALQLVTPQRTAVLFFERGQLSHAECGELTGEAAVLDVVKACSGSTEGTYTFRAGAKAGTCTVFRSATELLLNALRELDEEHERAMMNGGGIQ